MHNIMTFKDSTTRVDNKSRVTILHLEMVVYQTKKVEFQGHFVTSITIIVVVG